MFAEITRIESGRTRPAPRGWVMIVEDDEMCRLVLRDMLSLMGLPTLIAQTAEQGWELFKRHSPDAVITDSSMPGRGGLWLARAVKRAAPQVRVIMLSALPPPEAERVCDVVLYKPTRLADLREALAPSGARAHARIPLCRAGSAERPW